MAPPAEIDGKFGKGTVHNSKKIRELSTNIFISTYFILFKVPAAGSIGFPAIFPGFPATVGIVKRI
jgi:hypothetical protein